MRETVSQDQQPRRPKTTLEEAAEPNLASRIFAGIYFRLKGQPTSTGMEGKWVESDND